VNNEPGPEELRRDLEEALRATSQPSTVKSQDYIAKVVYNISPESIPRRILRAGIVQAQLLEEFGSRFDRADILSNLPHGSDVSDEGLMQLALLNDRVVAFESGWLRITDNEPVTAIVNYGFGEQSVFATVNGESSQAEYLCKRMLLLLWKSAGVARRWAELEPAVESWSYQTTTIVDVGVPLMKAFSDPFQSFLSDDLVANQGKFMGSFGDNNNSSSIKVVPHCRQIDLHVSVLDEVSGFHEDCSLNILVHTKKDANGGRCKITSELPSAKHHELVQKLVEAVRR
jgi:hypothetical protein